jgi:hypothetical protein
MGRPKRAFGDERLAGLHEADDAVDLGSFERFFQRQRWQNGRQPLGEHGLSGSRRANEKNIVTTGGGDLQRTLHRFLAFDLGKIYFVIGDVLKEFFNVHFGGRDFDFAFEERSGFAQVLDGNDAQTFHDGRFSGVIGGDEEAGLAIGAGAKGDRQDAFDGTDGSGKGEFANHGKVVELVGLDLFAGGEDADGDGEIEAGAFFFDVGGSEVDGRAAHGEFEGGIADGGADAVLEFADGSIWKADDDDLGIAITGVDLDFNRIGFDAVNGGGQNAGQHRGVMAETGGKFKNGLG